MRMAILVFICFAIVGIGMLSFVGALPDTVVPALKWVLGAALLTYLFTPKNRKPV